MATTVRLPAELKCLLREQAQTSGRSQKNIIQSALENALLNQDAKPGAEPPRGTQSRLQQPASPYREAAQTVTLPANVSILELLDREDQI